MYVVQLIAWSGLPECADTVERFVVAYSNGDILISEAFSPNDDAKNEVFYIEGLENFPNTKVWIYNRWGNLVFHSENYQNDWNGISQSGLNIGGSQLPEGTYYYVVELGGDLILEKDNSVKTGFVVLRR